MDISLSETLKTVITKMVNPEEINFLYGPYVPGTKIKGADSNLQPLEYGEPKLAFERLSLDGTPIHLYFKIENDQVIMDYKFTVQTDVADAVPMILRNLNIKLIYPDHTQTLNFYMNRSQRPQEASGTEKWKDIQNFIALKKAILKEGGAKIEWSGKFLWFDITSPELQEKLKQENAPIEPQSTTVGGTIDIDALEDSHMFEDVKNLLCWEKETFLDNEGHSHTVYFKDPFKDDAIYFLPQEYRIKALSNNAPDITTEIVDEEGGRKILTRIRIAPYVNPNAKRNAYTVFLRRKGKKYCELRYGGFNCARFEWGQEMPDGKLYGKEGYSSIVPVEEIQAGPESSFVIVLKTPYDGAVQLFQDKLLNEGIAIGNVYFKVYDGIDAEKEHELGPIPVELNMHKLTGIHPEVKTDQCTWPNYIATITNRGQYPIKIGGLTLSLLKWKNNKVTDAEHNLMYMSDKGLPVTLDCDASVSVKLTEEQADKIKHAKFLGMGTNEDYWNQFICEPYTIRLNDEDLKEIITKTNESAATPLEEWTQTIMADFNWSDHPDLKVLQIGLRNKFGINEIVSMVNGDEQTKVSMTPNLNAALQSKNDEKRIFEYRIRQILNDGPTDSEWTAWRTNTDMNGLLFIYEDDLKEPTVPDEPDPQASESTGTTQPAEPETQHLTLNFRVNWTPQIDKAFIYVIYDDEQNQIHLCEKEITLIRGEIENQSVTLRIKNPEIKPRIIVKYNCKQESGKNSAAFSDLTTVTNTTVILPGDAPISFKPSPEFQQVWNAIRPPKERAARKRLKDQKWFKPAIALVFIVAFLCIVFNLDRCKKNTIQTFRLAWDENEFVKSVKVDVKYDDDSNSIHYAKTDTVPRQGSLTFNIPTKNPKIKPQYKVCYTMDDGDSALVEWMTVDSTIVLLPNIRKLSFQMDYWKKTLKSTTIYVKYDDDSNSIHYAKNDTIQHKQTRTFYIPIKNSEITPKFKVHYLVLDANKRLLYRETSYNLMTSGWLPATKTSYVLPDDAPASSTPTTRPSSINTVTRPSSTVTVTRPSASTTVTRPSSTTTVTRPSSTTTVSRPSSTTVTRPTTTTNTRQQTLDSLRRIHRNTRRR